MSTVKSSSSGDQSYCLTCVVWKETWACQQWEPFVLLVAPTWLAHRHSENDSPASDWTCFPTVGSSGCDNGTVTHVQCIAYMCIYYTQARWINIYLFILLWPSEKVTPPTCQGILGNSLQPPRPQLPPSWSASWVQLCMFLKSKSDLPETEGNANVSTRLWYRLTVC